MALESVGRAFNHVYFLIYQEAFIVLVYYTLDKKS